MSLHAHAISGRPNGPHSLSVASVNGVRLIALAVGSHIDLCDEDYNLRQTLIFSDAFPAAKGRPIDALLATDEGKVIAAAGSDIAIWEKRGSTWQIHSSLQTAAAVTCLAYAQGTLFVGGAAISLWSLDAAARLPLWRKRWTDETYGTLSHISVSKDGKWLAAVAEDSAVVQTWAINGNTARPLSDAWHPTSVERISWKSDGSALFTQADNGAFRIWATMIDEPDFFVLWATVNHTPFAGQPSSPRPLVSYWIDADALGANTSNASDSLLTVFADGSLGVASVQNVGRIPPTCVVQHFSVTCQRALTKAQVASLRHSHLVVDTATRQYKIFGHSENGTLLSASLSSLSARPRCIEYRRRASAKVVSLSSASDASKIWRLSEDGEVGLHEAPSLATLASVKVPGTSRLVALDASTAAVVHGRQLSLVRRSGRKVEVTQSVDGSSSIVELYTQDGRVLAVDDNGATSVYSIEEDRMHLVDTWKAGRKCLAALPWRQNLAQLDAAGNLELELGKTIRTGRKPAAWALAQDGHFALASDGTESSEVTIWDTIESEFTTGLDYQHTLPERVEGLHWLDTGGKSSLLAIQCAHTVHIIGRARRRYFAESSAWSVLDSIPLVQYSLLPISAVAWLPSGDLVVAIASSLVSLTAKDKSLLDQVISNTSPLPVYHPQLLQQLLLGGKAHIVDAVLLSLAERLRETSMSIDDGLLHLEYDLDAALANKDDNTAKAKDTHEIDGILSISGTAPEYDAEHARRIVDKLSATHTLPLDADDSAELAILAQTAFDIKSQRRAIDLNGMRYLVAMRTFALAQSGGGRPKRQRLHFRDVVWAFHSQTQEILLQTSIDAHGGKMNWEQARSVGIFQWLKGPELLAQHMDFVGRNTYNANEERDPIPCLLFYFALRKRKLVHGLWKQAIGHPDRTNMLKFLMNNFDEPRWQTAARKNAYSLLSKQRFELAASFFLLGDSLNDAVSVCLRQLNDFQLAIAIARVYEGNDQGPVLRRILETHVVPLALGDGHRWLASWAFWMLNRRDLAVRVIVSPFSEIAPSLPFPVAKVGEPDTDDPALVILLAELRDRTLQTMRGSTYISGRTEFQFVLYMARILREMGCHLLALDLVRSWAFAEPPRSPKVVKKQLVNGDHPIRPIARRRSSLLQRKQSSVIADIPSTVVSRAASPELLPPPQTSNTMEEDEREAIARLAKQNRKQVQSVADFDMSAFGF